MNPKAAFGMLAFSAGLAFFTAAPAVADDSAASIAAGGLVSRRETRVVMAKEVLRISPNKIVVDYDFRNDTDEDVTTEVAFPIPPYGYGPDDPTISDASFSGFRLSVDGKPVAYRVEAKATLKGKDVTNILTSDHIDIATFGHLREPNGIIAAIHTPDVERLPKAEQQRLAKLGLYDAEDGWGMWMAHLQYHWTQTFPAHSTVHIRHEYTPVEGFEEMPVDTFKNALAGAAPGGQGDIAREQVRDLKLLNGFCSDPSFLRGAVARLEALDEQTGRFAYPQWVDFILTSANTWKQPIEDFTLIVERGKPSDGMGPRSIEFCSPQKTPVTKLDANTFQVHLTNFVPQSELRIGFFDFPAIQNPKPAAKH
jgi:hypothetical protein